MRTLGVPHEFKSDSWLDVRDRLSAIASTNQEFSYVVEIIDSVIESGRTGQLAVKTSMFDILVTPTPVGPPPLEVLRVYAPDFGRRSPAQGNVRIEHQSLTGRNDDLERPATEAVALFWRFVIEKFGVQPHDR